MGQRNPSTIRLHGNIGGQPMEVLIGNGDTLSCSEVCSGVALELDGNSFSIDLFVLPIHEVDVPCLDLASLVDHSPLPVSYKWGKDNIATDAFLCQFVDELPPVEQSFLALSVPTFEILQNIRDCLVADAHCATLLADFHSSSTWPPGYSLRDGLLFYHGRVVVPAVGSLS
ncbi:hypothetical protein Patl1_25885 [Pistacia atlantica]|uniref:Uncharacterized protein n=1 Tax=Pistacia atlantica TaxID=434234 RepID=A0ACC1B141_9ROSI|nr:hypothetical protein Patl1_25885 [Pistacia atlantica]